ncbi:MAG: polyprenyl synthetase family protein [Dysgonamonadaceae bacterium]|jgi:geranylgeranyl diphosphate synthase type II|nr:polyprenyl synthetase family protein [Dysgonamonadaceae bacterium]
MITFQDALKTVTEKIADIRCSREPFALYEPVFYLLSLKGKKLRPALAILSANLYKDDVESAIEPALAWEIFHNFTLMHDDVMDKADLRRGMPTVHKKWNENTAILSGDAMLIISYMFMNKADTKYLVPLLNLFSETALQICEGQQFDMDFEKRLDVSEAEYLNMIRLKTAVMLGACLKTGAIIGEAPAGDADKLYDFGLNLGIAFQIRDDLLDVYGNPETFGKKTGGDILCNKKTWLLINALNSAEDEEKTELMKWLNTNGRDGEKIAAVRHIYDSLGLKEKANEAIEHYYRKADAALKKVEVDYNKKTVLFELANELTVREI